MKISADRIYEILPVYKKMSSGRIVSGVEIELDVKEFSDIREIINEIGEDDILYELSKMYPDLVPITFL